MSEQYREPEPTLTACLETLAEERVEGLVLVEGEHDERRLAYADLHRRALQALGHLQSLGLEPGDEVVLQVPDNEPFVVAFWACVLCGAVPVPLMPAHEPVTLRKLVHVLGKLERPWVITVRQGLPQVKMLARSGMVRGGEEIAKRVVVIEDIDSDGAPGTVYPARPDDVAFVQFSSGSTGDPRGVVLTHANVLANIRAIRAGMRGDERFDRGLSWLPLTHDMGLIGGHLYPLVFGVGTALMNPLRFVETPWLWLQKVSEHGASTTVSPNFGYKLFLRSFDPARAAGWDLSKVRVIFNGAEPVSLRLAKRFQETLAPFGLAESAVFPVYGLAEATLAVAFPTVGDRLRATVFRRDKLSPGDVVETLDADDPRGVPLVSLGRALPGTDLRIADEDEALAEGVVGEIQVRGAGVTSGYHRDAEATASLFTGDGWLRTGDLGVVHEGELYFAGRIKEMIIAQGANYYPQDLETVLEEVDGVRPGRFAVVGAWNETLERDEIVAFVRHEGPLEPLVDFVSRLRRRLLEAMHLDLDAVVPVARIPRTTSGKIQRVELSRRYRAGDFDKKLKALAALMPGPSSPAVVRDDDGAPAGAAIAREIWSEVLALPAERLEPGRSFTELGGRSLQAVAVIARIEERLGLRLPVHELFAARDVEDFARRMDEASAEAIEGPVRVARDGGLSPLSPAQRRLWLLDRLGARDTAAYHIPWCARVEGALELDRLSEALATILRRHESLRTEVVVVDGEPMQRVVDRLDVAIERLNGGADDPRTIARDFVRPFDLGEAPLLRVGVARLSGEEHLVVLDAHHLVVDGASLRILAQELVSLYAGASLPEPELHPADVEAWMRTPPWQERLERQRERWASRLPIDVLGGLEIPTDWPRPAVRAYRGFTHRWTITPRREEQLQRLARSSSTTPFMISLATFGLVLARWTGARDVVIGTPVEGRRHPRVAGVGGLFVNTLPVRVTVEPDATARELLDRTRAAVLDALENQDVPLDDLVEHLGAPRDASRNPLFDVMVSMQPGVPEPVEGQGLRVEIEGHPLDVGASQVDLTLHVAETPRGLAFALQADAALFRRSTVRALAGAFDAALQDVVEEPDRPVVDVRLRETPVAATSAREALSPEVGDTVWARFEAQARREPARPAVTFDGVTMSYGALLRRAELIAGALGERGVGRGDAVATALDRSTDTVAAFLGVLRACAVHVPVSPRWPGERQRFVVDDAGAEAVILGAGVDAGLAEGRPAVRLDRLSDGAAPALGPCPELGDPAYVIYTSGTSGEPKGVRITHRNVAALMSAVATRFDARAGDVWSLFHDAAFDFSIWEMLGPLLTGGRIVVVPREATLDMRALVELLAAERVTVLSQTPSVFESLAREALRADAPALSLRAVVFGGEVLPAERLRAVRQRWPELRLFNMYGITEGTVHTTSHEVTEADIEEASRRVGRPLPGVVTVVADAAGRPLPAGMIGELLIGGETLCAGYHRRPELDAERFVADPELGRLFRTGDRARLLEDGSLEILGRFDRQVQLQGHRVELGEVEAALRRHDAVREAVVVDRAGADGLLRLEAYVVLERPVRAPDLANALARWLPDYMAPSRYWRLAALPTTPTGKLDRRALHQHAEPLDADREAVAATTELERAILEVWREVLELDDLGVTDRFFEVGGNSLRLVRVHDELRRRLGLDLRPVDLFTYPTIRGLARHIERGGDKPRAAVAPAPVRRARGGSSPIAVVGLGLRIGPCASHEELWSALIEGRELVRELPEARRRDVEAYARCLGQRLEDSGLMPMTFLDRIDLFDPGEWGLSPRDAAMMDPAQRLFFDVAADALSDAALPWREGPSWHEGPVGIFVGHSAPRFRYDELVFRQRPPAPTRAFLGTLPAMVPGRLAHALDLHGPTMAVDTACSSSLVALHLAVQALRRGECAAAIVGAAHVELLPLRFDVLGEVRSPDGRTLAFDDRARGFGVGEGAVVLCLEPLEKALAEGRRARAVILGSAVNHDGRSAGIAAPNVQAQAALYRAAWSDAGIDPELLSRVEAHGTGTALGDVVEVEGLRRAFAKHTDRRAFCSIGSIKANVGHLDAAAGLASVAGAILAMEHGMLPPQAGLATPSREIDWSDGPLRLERRPREWTTDGPRRCGVSAFGLSGTNAHVLLEERGEGGAWRTERPRRGDPMRCWIELDQDEPAAPDQSPWLPVHSARAAGVEVHEAKISGSHWLAREHSVAGSPVLVGTALLAMIAEVGRAAGDGRSLAVEGLELSEPVSIPPEGEVTLQLLTERRGDRSEVRVLSERSDGEWITHAAATISAAANGPVEVDLDELAASCPQEIDLPMEPPPSVVETGPRWRCLESVRLGSDRALARIALPERFHDDLSTTRLHPATLDVAVSFVAAVRHPGALPVGARRIVVRGATPPAFWSEIREASAEDGADARYDVCLIDDDGEVFLELDGLAFRGSRRPAAAPPLYLRRWVEIAPAPASEPSSSPKRVAIIGPMTFPPALALRDLLSGRGVEVTTPAQGSRETTGADLVVHFAVADPPRDRGGVEPSELAVGFLGTVRSVLEAGAPPRIVVVGAAAERVGGEETRTVPGSALVYGLVRTFSQEREDVAWRAIDVDEGVDVEVLWREMLRDDALQVLALRGGRVHGERLERLAERGRREPIDWSTRGAILITGAFGGIGREVARHLARAGASRLALLGRSAPRAELIAELRSRGVEVVGLRADVAEEAALEEALDEARSRLGPIDVVIHAAGVPGAGLLEHKGAETLREVLRPKVEGTRCLDAATRRDGPSLFVLFSSTTALHGWRGQGDATAANAFLDAFASWRQENVGETLSIAWPAWREVGMAADRGLGRDGLFEALRTDEALAGLDEALRAGAPRVIVGRLNAPLVAGFAERSPLLLAGEVEEELRRALEASRGHAPPEVTLTGAGAERVSEVTRKVAAVWGEVLGYDAIDIDADLVALGGDSLAAVGIVNRLNQLLGLAEPPGSLLRHRTVRAFARHLEAGGVEQGGDVPYEPIPRASIRAHYPLSAAQRRLYVLHRLDPESLAYNLPVIRVILGRLDGAAVEAAFARLIERHETLRTSFPLVDGLPVQRVHREVAFAVERRTVTARELDRAVHEFVRPFDLTRAPLLRVGLYEIRDEPDRRVLLFDVHHIVADAFSTEVLLEELMALARGAPLPPFTLQYRDYAVWQNEALRRGDLEAHARWWLDRFSGGVPVVEIPLDERRPERQRFDGDALQVAVPEETVGRWRRFAKERRHTLHTVVLGALFAWLRALCAQDDLIVATVALGRTRREVERLVGPFLNLLPIAVRAEGTRTVASFLNEVERVSAEAVDHQDFPFDALVERLDLPRDLSRNPVADVYFSFMSFEGPERDWSGGAAAPFGDLRVEPWAGAVPRSSKADLMVYCRERPRDLLLDFEYAAHLFRRATVERMAEAFVRVADAMVRAPEATLDELDLLSDEERETLCRLNASTVRPELLEGTIVELFDEQVEAKGGAPAILCGEETIGFAELQAMSAAAARALDEVGGAGERVVAVLGERRPETISTMLGALRAGWAFLPLDPRHPTARLEAAIAAAGVNVVAVTERTAELVTAAELLRLDRLGHGATCGIEDRSAAAELAYVITTSGTTGEPKGVEVTHRALRNFVGAMQVDAELSAARAILAATSFSFDIFLLETLAALASGVTVVLLDDDEVLDVRRALSIVVEREVDTVQLTPSRLRQVLDIDPEATALAGVERLYIGGEPLSARLLERSRGDVGRFRGRLFNLYGPTETTVWSTVADLTAASSVTIGRPIANTRVWVVGEAGKLRPPGVPGELWISGAGLARGYRGDAESTARRFVELSIDPDGRAYRTGDRARLTVTSGPGGTPELCLEVLGRLDDQVKVRGHRVELGEVEEALRGEGIEEAVVVAARDARDEVSLAAYLVGAEGQDLEALRRGLARRLPEYMVPAWLIPISEIPLTVAGKVDRRRLPAPSRGGLALSTELVEPSTDLERIVAETWARALGLDEVGIDDDFYALGGSSLKLVQIASLLEARLGREVPLVDLFAAPTVRAVAAVLERADDVEPDASGEPAPPDRSRLIGRRGGAADRDDRGGEGG